MQNVVIDLQEKSRCVSERQQFFFL